MFNWKLSGRDIGTDLSNELQHKGWILRKTHAWVEDNCGRRLQHWSPNKLGILTEEVSIRNITYSTSRDAARPAELL